MPLKLHITIDNHILLVDGDFTFDEVRPVLTQFLNAITDEPDPVQVLADKLTAQTDAMEAAIAANTPPAPPPDTGGITNKGI